MQNGVKLSVSLKDTDLFHDIAELLKRLFEDERIAKNVRDEYKSNLKELLGGDG